MNRLIIATRCDPLPVLKAYIDHVAISRPIVIFHQCREMLMPCFAYLSNRGVMTSLVSNFCREMQVQPGRTHPVMMMPGSSGFILHTTKVEPFSK